jgi:acylphosphatase
MPALSFHITGHVQDVCFRASLRDKATELKLCGWVQNTEEGGVKAYAEGTQDALTSLKEWCHQGPTAATVETVQCTKAAEQGLPDFTILC